ncbi:hypothetical protein VST63_13925 [Mycolicibacterium sp. 050232]|uniref:DUF6882 domain-containing protein n=1 Tax=Mycolicibacterium sp. 050232 TaxID=3113982 RepID=UPI002E2C2350|nr:DUF6882 domain-containing protein [Mycolicibacterium sp. 050232]MED5813455.1 hypothetical protein [Mycolicibacterium sp. 050232]
MFEDMLLDAAIVQAEVQAYLVDLIGDGTPYDGAWNFDSDTGLFSLASTRGVEPFVVQAQVLGAAGPEAGIWEWAWANPDLPLTSVYGSTVLRDFGELNGIAELRDAEVPLGDMAPREFAWQMAAIASLNLGLKPCYTFDLDSGTVGVIVLTDERLRLPAPSAPRLLRCVGEALQAMPVAPRSVYLWAAIRQAPIEEIPGGLRLALPDGHAELLFDEHDRLINMSGQVLPSA